MDIFYVKAAMHLMHDSIKKQTYRGKAVAVKDWDSKSFHISRL